MKIFEVHATTGTTALILSTRATVEEKALPGIIEKAIAEYGRRIVKGPEYLREYNLRIVITEMVSDAYGIFKCKKLTYRDYKFENDGVVYIGTTNITRGR